MHIALDCEMVGVGPGGWTSALARVCIVNHTGNVLLDTHVAVEEPVTDFRTKYSGVRPADIADAPSFADVQATVARLLQQRILVGHALENDLQALKLTHPSRDTRDTALYPPLCTRRGTPRKLKTLAREVLGVQIQSGEHSPDEDARAALYIYRFLAHKWEASLV